MAAPVLRKRELAVAVGVNCQTISSIEAARYVPSTVLVLKISRNFGKSVGDIFTLEEGD